jgi:hypothetical protein
MFNGSRVDRARRSIGVNTTSPASSAAMAFFNWARSVSFPLGLLAEHLGGACGRQLLDLFGEVLVGGRDVGIAKNHPRILQRTFATANAAANLRARGVAKVVTCATTA